MLLLCSSQCIISFTEKDCHHQWFSKSKKHFFMILTLSEFLFYLSVLQFNDSNEFLFLMNYWRCVLFIQFKIQETVSMKLFHVCNAIELWHELIHDIFLLVWKHNVDLSTHVSFFWSCYMLTFLFFSLFYFFLCQCFSHISSFFQVKLIFWDCCWKILLLWQVMHSILISHSKT